MSSPPPSLVRHATHKLPTGAYGTFRAGCTKQHLNAWLRLTHDPFVIESIQGVQVDLEEKPFQGTAPNEFQMSKENANNLTVVVAEHLSKGIIEKCTPCKGQFLSNIFLRPKPNGKHRLILDLSDLNDSVTYRHFKMESLQTAINMVQKHSYMGSLDLSDAYYSIPIAQEDKKLLRFTWGGGGADVSVHMSTEWAGTGTKNLHQSLEASVRDPAGAGPFVFRLH